MKYNLDDKVPIGPLLLYGLQWFILLLPCVIIMGIVAGRLHSPDTAAHIWYMRKLLVLMGGVTVFQILLGHRLPLVVGPATVLLVGVLTSLASGVDAIYTSIAVGGLVVAVLAWLGLLTKIRLLFTPRITATILMLIAFTLAPTILNLIFPEAVSGTGSTAGHRAFHLFFTLGMVVGLIVCNTILPGIWKSLTIPLGLAAGCAVYFSVLGPSAPNGNANPAELSLLLNGPVFDPGTILSFLICFLALIINEFGSIEALGRLLHVPDMEKRIRRGLGIQGLASVAAGSLGVIGSVDFSMSAGIVGATGCASRFTLLPAGFGLIFCGLLPGAASFLNTIPNAVMGALLLYLMATQLASGLLLLAQEHCIASFDSCVIMGTPLMVGLFVSFAPAGTWAELPDLLRPLLGNGFIMGTLTVVLLEHIVFRHNIS